MGRRWGEQEGTGEGDAAMGGAAAAAAGAHPAEGQRGGRRPGNEAEAPPLRSLVRHAVSIGSR